MCKEGYDCEVSGTHFVDFAKLSAAAEGEDSGSGVRVASLTALALLLALLVTVLAVVYYRRRMQRMKKDLDHRYGRS
jgi:membrane protein implicated in regulation of membrane protease activity